MKLITEMVSDRSGKIFHFVLSLYGGDSSKPYKDNYFLILTNKNLFLCQHLEINLVLLFNRVSESAEMMETFFQQI